VRVVVAATAEVAIPTLEWLKESKHELLRVVTTPDSKAGRGKILAQSVVADWADKNSISLAKPNTSNDIAKSFDGADVVIAIAYGKILTSEVFGIPKYGCLNLHFSLLPTYRGAAPVQRALLNGDSVTGISIFKIDEGLDTGPIYYQEKYEINPMANSGEVLRDLSLVGAKSFSQVLSVLEASTKPREQETAGISLAPKVSKEEARISWGQGSVAIINLIRAFTPLPGAWTTFQGSVLKVVGIGSASTAAKVASGSIHVEDKKLFVGTADFPIEISKLIPAGKKEMFAADWLNGARIVPGDAFE
jgi:methionyl-tRNA formyltransferase